MKRLCFILLSLLLLACAARAEGPFLGNLYAPILNEWREGLAAGPEAELNRDAIQDARRCVWNSGGRDPLESIGYQVIKLNDDDIPELIIGTVDEAAGDGALIFEILTLMDNRPVTLLQGWERNRLTLTYDLAANRFGYYREGSSGAANSVWEHGLAAVGRQKMEWTDCDTMEANWLEADDRIHWTLNGAEIGEEEAETLIAAWQEQRFQPLLTPFTEYENHRDTGFVDGRTPDVTGGFCRSFNVAPEGPTVDLVIIDTGGRNAPEARHENVLSAEITLRETGETKRFMYDSAETPAADPMSCLAWIQDLNFDGYGDLLLCAARGAANEYSVFCLWEPEKGQFGDIQTHCAFDLETERTSDRVTPLELVNYTLRREDSGARYIISRENDGVACYTQLVYRWDGDGPELIHAHDISPVIGSLIRERAFLFSSQGVKLWDHMYPTEWYYGATDPFRAFEAAADAFWQGGEIRIKHVANTDWVNLREWDSKQSTSLARLDRGTEVRVLMEDCADGWTLVLWDTGESQEFWFGNRTGIGYIWHSFLE